MTPAILCALGWHRYQTIRHPNDAPLGRWCAWCKRPHRSNTKAGSRP